MWKSVLLAVVRAIPAVLQLFVSTEAKTGKSVKVQKPTKADANSQNVER